MPVRPAALALLLMAGAASAAEAGGRLPGPDPFSDAAPHRVRARHPARVAVPPPRARIVTGYLPRNNNVPMYNAPPRHGPAW